ncbi:BN159_2729 family protein [Streptomyces sp. NPDC059651]|uniref:BN159_2729 family protein n=1 Tax=Streptomyces sp. NPDC059651 TaxID=3346897 RepID=UPI003688C92A
MNKNLPATITMVRSLLSGDGDVAQAIGHALDQAGLLVDPERTYGAVLRRGPEGWVPVTPPTPSSAEPTTGLEDQARAWDDACGRARQLAAAMVTQYAAEPDVTSVTVDGDTVVMSLHITDPARWAAWMETLGLTEAQVTGLDYVSCGRTSWGGVPLSVLAYDVPELDVAAAVQAKRPYRYAGVLYDLAVPHEDSQGDRWFFQGESADEMPLLSMDGRPERCTLASVVELVGPLSPVRELLTVAGGDR